MSVSLGLTQGCGNYIDAAGEDGPVSFCSWLRSSVQRLRVGSVWIL